MQKKSILTRVLAFTMLYFSMYSSLQASEAFPRPPELEPAIKFWTRVYTEVDTKQGFLHDAVNLAVVYRTVNYNREEIEQYRSRIRDDLRVLATGKRSGLTGHQQAVLEAWPDEVSNETLAAAANSVRFQLGQSDRFAEGLVRSGAYREHIRRVTEERGLPIELGALPHVESSFHPGAYSHANAAGMWQFIRATGQRFMRIDHIVDERMDPYTATYAAMSLLAYNYSLLGSWPLALTAYNHGAGGMARAVRETGSSNIEDIVANYRGRNFGFASRNFYAQLLAVLDVEKQAQAVFGVLQLDPAPEYEEIKLEAYVEARTLADALGVTIEQLRFDNPALRPVVWQGAKRVPRGYTVKIQTKSINGDLGRLVAGIPNHQLFAYQTPDVSYVVQRGDSLSGIARRFDTSVAQLASLNQLTNQHRIQIGQELLLPHDTNMASQTLLASNSSNASPPADGVYTVRPGDTVSVIAQRFNVNEAEFLNVNGITNPDRIYPGQALNLPGTETRPQQASVSQASSAPAAPAASAASSAPAAPAAPQRIQVAARTADLPLPGHEEALVAMTEDAAGTVPTVGEEADALAEEPLHSIADLNSRASMDLTADPSDYSVAGDSSIEIQASETLGHYADWLGIRAQELRALNNLRFNQPVIVGNRLRLDFSRVSAEEFELRRREFHIAQQQQFFRSYRIQDLDQYQIAANDNIGNIARQRYSVPLWLLRQYNPELDFRQVRIGQTVVFPVLEPVDDA